MVAQDARGHPSVIVCLQMCWRIGDGAELWYAGDLLGMRAMWAVNGGEKEEECRPSSSKVWMTL
jgi:hypothetical protein